MSQIGSKDTKAEITFRKLLWSKGYKGYRLHPKKIIGKPDLYFPKKRLAVFIDGCFWHKCPKCYIKPKTNLRFWNKKIEGNVSRDKKVNIQLKKEKIKIVHFWEHEIRKSLNKAYQKFQNKYESIQ